MAIPRQNRLQTDYKKIMSIVDQSEMIRVLRTEGQPPESYLLEIKCKSVESVDREGNPRYRDTHQLEIKFPQGYPHIKPEFSIVTPIFNPNIGRSGLVCFGDEYAPGMMVDFLILQTIYILRYQKVNPRSSANLDAGRWYFNKPASVKFPLGTSQILHGEILIQLRGKPLSEEIVFLEDLSNPDDNLDIQIL
jgi:ubiquitin-protein ligase